MGELCCHAHSNDDREHALDAMKDVPKLLPHPNEGMQYYLESLDDYSFKKPEIK